MLANSFAILNNSPKLAHAYLCYGDFKECEESFGIALKEKGVRLRSPGHYIFEEDTFGVDDARDLISWYQTGATSNDDTHTIAVISSKVIKKDAQQMLLKILEEAKSPYSFFIFTTPGTEIISTVLSRVSYIGQISHTNKKIHDLIKLGAGERLSSVASLIKNMESHEVRVFTEELVINILINLNESKQKDLDKINLMLQAQNALVESRIAPKFILDYVLAIL
jgi:hypothetical protein